MTSVKNRKREAQQAYQDAVNRLQADRQAKGQAAAQLATLAPNQVTSQLRELGAMQTVGEEKQQLTQNEDTKQYYQKGVYVRDDHCDWGSSGMNEFTEEYKTK